MTKEEAIKKLHMEWQRFLENYGDYAGISEAYKMAFKALNQMDILDKVRAEIEQLPITKCTETSRIYVSADDFKKNVFKVIDKHKEESGGS